MKKLLLAFVLLATPALAQQQDDPAILRKLLSSVQMQRNQAMDALASAETRIGIISDELAKAQKRVEELTKAQPNGK